MDRKFFNRPFTLFPLTNRTSAMQSSFQRTRSLYMTTLDVSMGGHGSVMIKLKTNNEQRITNNQHP
jgi:hypothetical protein